MYKISTEHRPENRCTLFFRYENSVAQWFLWWYENSCSSKSKMIPFLSVGPTRKSISVLKILDYNAPYYSVNCIQIDTYVEELHKILYVLCTEIYFRICTLQMYWCFLVRNVTFALLLFFLWADINLSGWICRLTLSSPVINNVTVWINRIGVTEILFIAKHICCLGTRSVKRTKINTIFTQLKCRSKGWPMS